MVLLMPNLEAEIAVLKEIALQNKEDHAEFKRDLKTLLALRWQIYGASATVAAVISGISLILGVVLK